MGRRRRQIKISTKRSEGVEEDLELLGKTELIAGLTAFSSLESSLVEGAIEWKVFRQGFRIRRKKPTTQFE